MLLVGSTVGAVKPEFLGRISALEPLEWLPKIQAKKFRLDDEIFDTVTPRAAKEQLRAATPPLAPP